MKLNRKSKKIIVAAIAERERYRVVTQINIDINHIYVLLSIADIIEDELVIDLLTTPKMVIIGDEAYTELVSDKPEWNEDKIEDYYNEDDILYIVDKIEDGTLKTLKNLEIIR